MKESTIENKFVLLNDGQYGFAISENKVLVFDHLDIEAQVTSKIYSKQGLSQMDLEEIAVEIQQSLTIKEVDPLDVQQASFNFNDIYDSSYDSDSYDS